MVRYFLSGCRWNAWLVFFSSRLVFPRRGADSLPCLSALGNNGRVPPYGEGARGDQEPQPQEKVSGETRGHSTQHHRAEKETQHRRTFNSALHWRMRHAASHRRCATKDLFCGNFILSPVIRFIFGL